MTSSFTFARIRAPNTGWSTPRPVASTLTQAGEQLGLGTLRRAALLGEVRASLLVLDKKHVLTLKIEPPKALPAVEKQVETSIPGQG
jgi:hypothetical protein